MKQQAIETAGKYILRGCLKPLTLSLAWFEAEGRRRPPTGPAPDEGGTQTYSKRTKIGAPVFVFLISHIITHHPPRHSISSSFSCTGKQDSSIVCTLQG